MLSAGNCSTAFTSVKRIAAFNRWGPKTGRHEVPVAVMFVPIPGLTTVHRDCRKGLVLSFGTGAIWGDLVGLAIDRTGGLQHLEVEGVQALVHPQCELLRLPRKGLRDRGVLRLLGVHEAIRFEVVGVHLRPALDVQRYGTVTPHLPTTNDILVVHPVVDHVVGHDLFPQCLENARVELKLFQHVHEHVEHGGPLLVLPIYMRHEFTEFAILVVQLFVYNLATASGGFGPVLGFDRLDVIHLGLVKFLLEVVLVLLQPDDLVDERLELLWPFIELFGLAKTNDGAPEGLDLGLVDVQLLVEGAVVVLELSDFAPKRGLVCKKELFATPRQFFNHQKRHDKTYQCNICQKTFKTSVYLEQHMKRSHVTKNIVQLESENKNYEYLKCDICDEKLSKHCMKQHVAKIHGYIKSFQCEFCNKTISTVEGLTNHITRVHEKSKPHQCELCQKAFADNAKMKDHIRLVHNTRKRFNCDDCGKSYTSKRNLDDHNKTIHLNDKFKCNLCEKDFKLLNNLKKHEENVHKANSHDDRKCFKCEFCNKAFSTRVVLTKHKSGVHTSSKSYACDICGARFAFSERLSRHMNGTHEKIKPFTCGQCEKSFTTKKDVERHVTVMHYKLKPHKCGTCSKEFSDKSNLHRHVRQVHEKSKPHQCELCKKSFADKGNMKVHVRFVHNFDKQFKCTKCLATFKAKQNLDIHTKSKHLNEKLKCKLCEKDFTSPGNLLNHEENVHEKIKPFNCDKCQKSFRKGSVLKEHINRVHMKLKPYKCDICEKYFSTKTEVDDHKAKLHNTRKRCTFCDERFSIKQVLDKHVKTIHLENNHLFKCNLCEESYTKQKQFEEHKANVHAIQFRCELCDKTFKIRRCLLRHLTRQHKK